MGIKSSSHNNHVAAPPSLPLYHSPTPPHPTTPHTTTPSPPPAAAAVPAGEEADDGRADGHDGADDCVQDGANAADNSHDAVAEGAESTRDLLRRVLVSGFDAKGGLGAGVGSTYT